MSIQSEITRISGNVSDALTAISNKGVTVPSGSNSDDLADLIALIESGGGGSGGTIYQDLDGYLHLSEDSANVISIVDTLDTAGGTIRTITGVTESSGDRVQYKSGTYTPSQDYTTTGNRLITTLSNIGFSPKKFIFRVTDRASVANTKSAALYSLADNDAAVRWSCRYSDTSNSVGQNRVFSDWTTQQDMYLYCDGTSVYYRTYDNQYFLFSGVSYTWEAFG